MDEERQQHLLERLSAIHKKVQWMADEEARSAWVRGFVTPGVHNDAKEHLLGEAERILDELEGLSSRTPQA